MYNQHAWILSSGAGSLLSKGSAGLIGVGWPTSALTAAIHARNKTDLKVSRQIYSMFNKKHEAIIKYIAVGNMVEVKWKDIIAPNSIWPRQIIDFA